MFRKRSRNTSPDLNHRTVVYDTKMMKNLDNSLYGAFRKCVMASIQQGMFMCLYSQFGAPNSAVDVIIGVMILAIVLGLSEDRILKDLPYNLAYQYALCINPATDKIPCKRTLIRFRLRCIIYRLRTGNDIFHQQCVIITRKMAAELGLKPEYFRMDSVMLNTYAQEANRSQLLYLAIQGVVLRLTGLSKHKLVEDERKNHFSLNDVLHRPDIKDLQELDHCLADETAQLLNLPRQLWHYLYMDDYNSRFYAHRNPLARTNEILSDAVLLWNVFHKELADWEEFKLFMRTIHEQCEWVLEFHSDGKSSCEYSGKKVLRFKLSREERAKAAKEQGHLKKLQNTVNEQLHICEKAETKYKAAIKKAEEAMNAAEKARISKPAKFEALQKKATNLQNDAESKRKDFEEKRRLYEEAMAALNAASCAIVEKEAYVVVDDSLGNAMQEMNSGILQTLNDCTATFCEKAGKFFRGFKLCCLENSDGEGRSMPSEWDTKPNNVSDAIMGAILIRRLKAFSSMKKYLTVDGAFSGKEIDEALKEANAEIINTEMTGQKVKTCYANIVFNEEGTEMICCPAGHEVQTNRCNKDGSVIASLDATICKECPHFKECAPTISNSKATIKASKKQKIRALFQQSKGKTVHSVMGRFRNGVEALMNLIKKKSPVTRQPIYGLERVALFNDCAVVACGFNKYLAQIGLCEENASTVLDYTVLFPEDETYLEEASKEIDNELKNVINAEWTLANQDSSASEAEAIEPSSTKEVPDGNISSHPTRTVEYALVIVQYPYGRNEKETEIVPNVPNKEPSSQPVLGLGREYIFIVDPDGTCVIYKRGKDSVAVEDTPELIIEKNPLEQNKEEEAEKEQTVKPLPVLNRREGYQKSTERASKRNGRRPARVKVRRITKMKNGKEIAFD